MNKNKWIFLISAAVTVVLAVVLLIIMLGRDVAPKEQTGGSNNISESAVMTDASDATSSTPTDTTAAKDNQGNTDGGSSEDSEGKEIQVEIDVDDEEFDENLVIDFDDLLEAAGK